MAIIALAEGMVLADDLYTATGVNLLAKGHADTASTLDTILRRHHTDPMVHVPGPSARASPPPNGGADGRMGGDLA